MSQLLNSSNSHSYRLSRAFGLVRQPMGIVACAQITIPQLLLLGGWLLLTVGIPCEVTAQVGAAHGPAVQGQTTNIVDQEMRIVWGGQIAKTYQGTISIKDGRLRLVRNLSVQPSAVGSIVQRDPSTIEIHASSETTFGGIDLVVEGSLSSRLRLEIVVSPLGEPVEHEVTLSDLQSQTWIQPLDEDNSRIAIERQLYDKLRVVDDRQSKIFQCGENWLLQASGERTGLNIGDYVLTAAWVGKRSGNPIASVPVRLDSSGSFPSVELDIKIPPIEGAHRLELALVRPSLVQKWAPQKPLLSRSVELVALSPQASAMFPIVWRPVLEIDTVAAVKSGNLNWLISFANNPLSTRGLEIPELPGLSQLSSPDQWNRFLSFSRSISSSGPVQQSGRIVVQEHPLKSQEPSSGSPQHCITMEPGAWLTLPLSGLKTGQPHKLRIEVPKDSSGMLTVSIKDAADSDRVAISPQQTFVLPKSHGSAEGPGVSQEILFWPRSDSVQVVLYSSHRSQSASVGKIVVESTELGGSSNISDSHEPIVKQDGRNIGIYIDQPFLADCLAAPRERDPKTGGVYETWATWQAVAERLVFHLKLSGANTLILLAACDGGSLFPIKSLQTVPWLDKSAYFTDGRSPQSHDFIELLLRHFERNGLQLVIEIDTSSNRSLSSLGNNSKSSRNSTQLDGHPQEAIADSSEPRAFGSSKSQRNPLDSTVQAAASDAVREIAQQYKDFPALAGISLRLRPNSHLVFASDNMEYDVELQKEYLNENGLQLPKAPEQLKELFGGTARLAYMNWRADRLSSFYEQLTRTMRGPNPELKLYLNTIRLWEKPESEQGQRDQEAKLRNPGQFLLEFGLDVEKLSAIDGLVITQGTVRNGWTPLASSDWNRSAAAELGAEVALLAPQAALITHQPRSRRLVSDNQASELVTNEGQEKDSGQTIISALPDGAESQNPPVPRLYVDSVVCGKLARQAVIDQLFRADQQLVGFGGWYPVWTLEPQVSDLVSTFKSLPPVVLEDVPLLRREAPIRIRQGKYDGRDYFVLVNASTWECELTLLLEKAETPAMNLLGSTRAEQIETIPGEISISLDAGGLTAWTWQGSPPEITSAEYSLSEQGLATISQQLSRMESTMVKASDPSTQKVLFHGSGTFEQWTSESKPTGWNVSSLPNTVIQRAIELPHSGQNSILIENNNQGAVAAWIQSDAIEVPRTGRLALRAWLRSSAADHRQPLVRLGIVGRLRNGSRYQQSIFYGNVDAGARPIANDWGRRPAELYIADVPVDELVELQVAVDLIGNGKVWVDDVEVVETWLHPDERNYLRGQLLVAKQNLAEGSSFSAERFLRSQWVSYLEEMESSDSLNQTVGSQTTRKSTESAPTWPPSKTAFQQWRDSLFDRWRR